MSAGTGSNINTQNSITSQQLGVASDASKKAGDDYSQYKALLQPLLTQQQALATGNRDQALSAAMPVISKLSSGFSGAKASIMNSMPAGAARDRAMADLSTNMYTGIGGAQADAVRQAPSTLANVGQSLGAMSLQELGAALSGYQGASSTNQSAAQMTAQKNQALTNFLGSLAGSGSGFLSKLL